LIIFNQDDLIELMGRETIMQKNRMKHWVGRLFGKQGSGPEQTAEERVKAMQEKY
jgi:hypothetical protein